MEIKLVKSTKELPDWFSLDKYRTLNSNDSEQLFHQAASRLALLKSLDNIDPTQEPMSDTEIDSDWPKTCVDFEDLCSWENIKKDGVISKESTELMESSILGESFGSSEELAEPPTKYAEKYLNSTHVIFPLKLIDAEFIGYEARKKIEAVENKTEDCLKIPLSFDVRKNYDIECGDGKNIHLAISLKASDNEILGQLKRLMPLYRANLECAEPESLFKKSDLKRIIDFKVIELLDLKIWSKIHNLNITHSVLATALFPDGSKGDTELRRTILPLTEKVLTDRYQDEWLSFI